MVQMASAEQHLSAPSDLTAAGAERLMTDHQPGVSVKSLPIIDLPHKWDERGYAIAESWPGHCPRCGWRGDPLTLFHWPDLALAKWDRLKEVFKINSFDCASCELLRCLVSATSFPKGRRVTDPKSIRELGNGKIVHLDDLYSRLRSSRFYVSASRPALGLDSYDLRRLWIPDDTQLFGKSFEWAEECIAECELTHQYCHSQQDKRYLPTRLIKLRRVGKDYDIRVEHHDSIRPGCRYIALSYCWGDYKPACMTTTETLQQNMDSIPWTKLPRTFQDAAKFTLGLGIQYLWIDSICIIQNDERDWQQEAGKMYAVYKNAFLTLAPLSGSDSTCGLRTTSVKEASTPIAQLRFAESKTQCTVLYLGDYHYLDSRCEDDIRQARILQYPLIERAWAYQERIVAPRVMFFTNSEMIYQCLQGARCECGDAQQMGTTETQPSRKPQIFLNTKRSECGDAQRMGTTEKQPSRKSQIFLNTKRCSSSSCDSGRAHDVPTISVGTSVTTDRASEIARTWRGVVSEYSSLKVSSARDRLPAIGAIAQQFSNVRPNEQYLAGLWSGTLLQDLFWICSSSLTKHDDKTLPRHPNLPTWSWASLQRPVYYLGDERDVTPKATVVEAHCIYAGGNVFGVLESSRLILRGRILSGTLQWSNEGAHDRPFDLVFPGLDGDTRAFLDTHCTYSDIVLDHGQDWYRRSDLTQEVHILEVFLAAKSCKTPMVWHYLILRRECQSEIENVYTRAGVLLTSWHDEMRDYPGPLRLRRLFDANSVLTTCEIR